MSDFIGSGWSMRVGVDTRGRIALVQRERDIEEAIHIILLTPKGTRKMRPEFGCQIHDLLFAPNDASTAGLAAYYVEEALSFWEPRIEVENVDVAADEDNPERMLITIHYQVKTTLDRRALVFPFYRIPEEE